MAAEHRRRRWAAGGAIAAVTLLLASCAGQEGEAPADVAHWTNPQDPAGVGAPAAGLQGDLVLLDGCVVVVDDLGVETVPLLPTPVTWDEGVLVADGVRLELDSQVLLGGAERGEPMSSDVVPDACGDRAQFRVHQL